MAYVQNNPVSVTGCGRRRSKVAGNSPFNKAFEPHNMYDRQKAETHKEHLALKKKGYGHSPYKKAKGMDGKACWKGYKLQGTKKKGGRTVDNCVKM